MKNIWIALIPSFIAYVVAIGIIVNEIIKKTERFYWLKIMVFVGIIIFLLVYNDIPLYKDLAEKDTRTVVGTYVKYQSKSDMVGAGKVFFEGEHSRFSAYILGYTRDITKMEIGKTYEIEYFCNSELIKEYRLVE